LSFKARKAAWEELEVLRQSVGWWACLAFADREHLLDGDRVRRTTGYWLMVMPEIGVGRVDVRVCSLVRLDGLVTLPFLWVSTQVPMGNGALVSLVGMHCAEMPGGRFSRYISIVKDQCDLVQYNSLYCISKMICPVHSVLITMAAAIIERI